MNFTNGGKPFRLARQPYSTAVPKREPPADPGDESPAEFDRWWLASSFDLLQGLDVQEASLDTLPAELADELLAIDLSRLSRRVRVP